MTGDSNGKAGNSKLWGGRFSAPTDRLADAYTSSTDVDERMLFEDIEASIAHATMLGRQNIIPKEDAERIVRALRQMAEEYENEAWELDPMLEDVHMNVESRLAEKIGAVAGKLHTARSRNDQVATDFRMYARESASTVLAQLARVQDALLGLAEEHIDAIMPGYTHMQRAQPVLFAHHLMAYVEMLERDSARFAAAFKAADVLVLGSGALAGVPYPIDREFVAEELQFHELSANSIDAVSDRDFVADYLHAAALAMVHISRLAEELILWSSAEFGFIRMPDAFSTGSSIMPQKRNSDIAELARGRTGSAIGGWVAMMTILKGLPLAYNRDLQEDKPLLFDAEANLVTTLDVLAAMLPLLTIDKDRMRAAAGGSFTLATDLADYLVRKGVPFREAHEIVGKLVRHAEEHQLELSDLPLAEMRRFSPLFDEDAREIDIEASVRSRDVPGGTAPVRVQAAITAARERLRKYAEEHEDRDEGAEGTRA